MKGLTTLSLAAANMALSAHSRHRLKPHGPGFTGSNIKGTDVYGRPCDLTSRDPRDNTVTASIMLGRLADKPHVDTSHLEPLTKRQRRRTKGKNRG